MKRTHLRRALAGIAVVLLALPAEPGLAARIKDAESATHGYDAASYQLVDTYSFPGFELVQFNLPVLSHYSYMLISHKETLVVDPGRDIDVYLAVVSKMGLAVKGVFLTHSHADFVAGHTEMAKATGCPVYSSAISGAEYKFEPVKEGTTLQVGRALVKFIETPGHTPDGLSALVFSPDKLDIPALVLTGDAKFVGGVGRPDLIVGTTSYALASKLYDTWFEKLAKLGDDVAVFPAHGAGSLCGAHLSDSPKSTIGAERASDPYVQHRGRSEFITAVLGDLQEPPQYFVHNATMNRKGPELVDWKAPLPKELAPDSSLTDSAKFYVVDLRDANDYAAGHIPNSVNIGLRGRLETWVGIMVPWGSNLVVTGSPEDLKEAVNRLHRVGYGANCISFGNWEKSGLPVAKSRPMEPRVLHELMQQGKAPMIVDVRLPNEWMGLRIGTVLNFPLNRLSDLSSKLDPSQPVVTVCNSAYRSSMAIGVLERKGFTQASSLAGGSEAWMNAGLPVFGAEAKGPAVLAAAKKQINLPDRICPSELQRLMMDLPGTFDLVDIRPPALFADYNIPGSVNVDIAEVLANPAYLTGAGPLILVDRDGTIALAVAGILSQKTKRPIKAVYGGVEGYWLNTEMEAAVGGGHGPAPAPRSPAGRSPARALPAPAGVAPTPAPPSVAPSAAPTAPQPPKRKPAGC